MHKPEEESQPTHVLLRIRKRKPGSAEMLHRQGDPTWV